MQSQIQTNPEGIKHSQRELILQRINKDCIGNNKKKEKSSEEASQDSSRDPFFFIFILFRAYIHPLVITFSCKSPMKGGGKKRSEKKKKSSNASRHEPSILLNPIVSDDILSRIQRNDGIAIDYLDVRVKHTTVKR